MNPSLSLDSTCFENIALPFSILNKQDVFSGIHASLPIYTPITSIYQKQHERYTSMEEIRRAE